jgi:hypothetical protein
MHKNWFCSDKCEGKFKKHLKPRETSNWQGGKIIRDGYIYIKDWEHPKSGKQGYIAEHRIVMERSIGRFLKKGEVIHHINGNRQDNRLSNLILCENPGKHIVLHHPKVFKKLMENSHRNRYKTHITPLR